MATNVPVTLDTLIVVKLQYQGNTRKFKLPLRDLGAQVLPEKLRSLLEIPSGEQVVFERYSDSAGAYVTLDSNKPQVYKTLFRAAKAKLKLRLRATVPSRGIQSEPVPSLPLPPAPVTPMFPAVVPPPFGSRHGSSQETLCPTAISHISPVIAQTPTPQVIRSEKQPEVLVAHSTIPQPIQRSEMQPKVESAQASPVSPLATTTTADADIKGEAPVPRPFPTTYQSFVNHLADVVNERELASRSSDLAFRPKMDTVQTSWVVYCNNCNLPMEDAHYHCSICDHGDYDLCPSCVDSGIHCPGSGHWMVKRFVKNGLVVNSTTERVGPKPKPEAEQEMPGAFTEEKQPVVEPVPEEPTHEEPTRTCNCCVQVLSEKEFVTCTSCDDYDLCMECHVNNKHGHHPGHAFKAATTETVLPTLADFLCNAGRNVRHSAVCDGCEKFIYGVRHKCLNCPDWDFCSECVKSAKFIHPGHRFVPIYEPLAEPVNTGNRHYGIYCDGPLCKDKENLSYIEGIRYKCAVCHDTDFCANCEAHPSNRHNHTHPLIKFKRPVRSVSVTTLNEDKDGNSITRVGDREPARRSTATETIPVAPSSNAATQVHTIVDMKPTEEAQPKTTKEKIEIRDLLTEPVQEKISVQDLLSTPAAPAEPVQPVMVEPVAIPKADTSSSDELDAHFIRESVPDGTKICTGFQFVQVWTLRNPGPNSWPAGCSVRRVGGDNMLNIDNTRPLSQSDLANASESNVIGRPVAPGEDVSFRVVMKAPAREGTAISYWRLKTADGTPFGHRLWCDIQVVSPPVPAPSQVPEPAEASSSSAANMSPYDRFQQEKMERIRLLQSTQAQLHRHRATNAKFESSEHSPRNNEETLERLRKWKPNLDEESLSRYLEKREREKMARIQIVRKAAVERLLETRRKEHEAYNALQQAVSEQEQAPQSSVKEETAELPVEEKVVESVAEEKPAEVEPQPEGSGMIFPQLEKESPASSTHEAVAPQPESPVSENATLAAPAAEHSDEDFFEDAESVEIRSITSDEDGFMTDEEYDILDASDEEMP